MSNWDDLNRFIEEADHILVVAHYNPDGDAISSTLAAGRLLRQYGKKVTLVNENKVPQRFLYLEDVSQIRQPADLTELYSYVVTVDCADLSRVGECKNLFSPDIKILNIDHHKTNDLFGLVNLVDVQAASTTQVIFNWLKATKLELDLSVAEMIYTGLLTDTGGFRFSNTTAAVMNIAAELIEMGVDPYKIADKAIESITVQYIQLLQIALSSLQVSEDGKIAWISLSHQDIQPLEEAGAEGLVQYTRNIIGVEVGLSFKEGENGDVKVSFRSKEYFDVATFAKQFGGGGHARAAGCTVKGPLSEARAIILEKLMDELERTNA